MKPAFAQLWAGWRTITGFIGDFQARMLLTAFYFTIAVPFGLLTRLVDPLHVRRLPADSGWMRREPGETQVAAARRQF